MRIRTQFLVTILLFGLVLIAISASAIITNGKVARANQTERTASAVALGANELSYLVNDYLIYRESQQLERCKARFITFSRDVESLQAEQPEQRQLIQRIKTNAGRLKEVFEDVVSAVGTSEASPSGFIDTEAIEVSWSRMAVQSQTLISDATRLSQSLHIQIDNLQRTNAYVLIALMCVFGAYFIVNYFLIQRRTLRSLANLQAGTNVIGSGNLDFKIKEKKNDEIGDLSRAFNRMTTSLKEVTASKADLEREIEQRKKAEEEARRYAAELETVNRELSTTNKELESFSYSVSHDLRAPLRSMDGFSQALLEEYSTSLDDQGKKWLQNIRNSSQHMGRLIDDILGLSRVVRAELNFEKVDLSEMAHSLAESLQRTEPERRVDFIIRPEIEAICDRNLLSLVLQNLLGNAFKFTSRCDHARIEFGFSQQDSGKNYFVQDNGAGFDMKYIDKLFKPFQRLHSNREYPGTGIGLVTVQRIIQRHGGEVWAQSEINKGATFYFTLDKMKQ